MAEARIHGGADAAARQACARLGVELLDLSVNVNPYGPPAALLAAVAKAPIDRYPDPSAESARRVLADRYAVDPGQVVVGAGAADLLWTCVRALLRTGDTWLSVEPTFSEATAAAGQQGCRQARWHAPEEDDFVVDDDAVSRCIERVGARAVYLCTPNNPTGRPFAFERVRALAARHPDTWLIVDQSFLALSESAAELEQTPPANVVQVRSLTKELSVPGLRTGYLLASHEAASRIEHARPAWSTGAGSQAAAELSVELEAFVADSRARMLQDRRRMEGVLRAAGLRSVPSAAPFVMARVGRASVLRQHLLDRHGVLVRDCASFGLPSFIRVCGLRAEHAERFEQALRDALETVA